MRLADLHPIIATDVIEALENNGISTVEEVFLIPSDELLRKMANSLSLSIQQLEGLRQEARQRLSALGTRANKLFADEHEIELKRENCYSGIVSLDELSDGFGTYGVTEIAGSKKSGRTSLVLNVVLRHMASYSHHKTVWFDVGGEFDIERTHMISATCGAGPGSATPEAMLENLTVVTCFEVATVHDYLRHLENSLVAEPHDSRTRFIVIDSLTPLLAPLLSASHSQGHAVMTTLVRRLTYLAQTYSLTVLIINDAVQFTKNETSNATLKSALDPLFTFLVGETLWLSSSPSRNEELATSKTSSFTAEVLHSHNRLSQGRRSYFTMRGGISLES